MARTPDAGRADPSGEIRFFGAPELPGITLIDVRDSAHLWRVFHETYTCCIIPQEGNVPGAASFWRYRGSSHVAVPGHLMLMEPGEVHETWKVTGRATYSVIQLPPGLVGAIAHDLTGVRLPHLRECDSCDRRVVEAMTALWRGCRPDVTTLARETLLARAVQQLIHCCGERPPGLRIAEVGTRELRLARDFIVAHYAERISLDRLVALTGVSRFHLLRSFERQFSVPPHRLQLLVRLSKAQARLLAGCPPADAAVGFADQSDFTRHFRRAFGTTPARYQRQALASGSGRDPRGPGAISF